MLFQILFFTAVKNGTEGNAMDRTKMLVTYFRLSEQEKQERFLPKSAADLLKKKLFAIGSAHIAVAQEDGTVTAYGDNSRGQCEVNAWRDVAKVAAGDFHTVALTKHGKALAAGDNRFGQCEVGKWDGLTDIFAQRNLTVGVKEDGSLLVAAATKPFEADSGQKQTAEMAAAIGQLVSQDLKTTFSELLAQIPQPEKPDPLPVKAQETPEAPRKASAVPMQEAFQTAPPVVSETPSNYFCYTVLKDSSEVILTEYIGSRPDVVIPRMILGKPVTVIANRAFANCKVLESVTFSDTLHTIRANAFSSCINLERVLFPDNAVLESIQDNAFENCVKLKLLVFPNSIKTIGRWAFSGCKRLEMVFLPDGIQSISFGAFSECRGLKKVLISKNAQLRLDRPAFVFDDVSVLQPYKQ